MAQETRLQDIQTPAVLIDQARLGANLESMQRLADDHKVALRPHAKTHKSVAIGRRQLALGAVGLTVATVQEAQVFLANGFTSLTVSRPVVTDAALAQLIEAGKLVGAQLRVVVDAVEGVDAAARQTAAATAVLGVFIKVDVGLQRCGVDPEGDQAVDLARRINAEPGLEFCGILSHAGQAYAADSAEKAAAIAADEQRLMLAVRDKLMAHGFAVPEVSVGSTPTVLAATDFTGITEIRPGNYAFLDLLPINVGVATHQQVALSVLATVISRNDQFFITDAGSKTLTSDAGVHGMSSAKGFGLAYPADQYLDPAQAMVVAGLSEEHGKVTRGHMDLPIGSRVRIIPNHACPVANLARQYTVIDGHQVLDLDWPVDAGLCSR